MRITVKAKLGLAFAAVIALSAVTAVIGVSSLRSLNAPIGDLLQGPVQRVKLINLVYTDLLAISRAERSVLAAPTPEMEQFYASLAADPVRAQQFLGVFAGIFTAKTWWQSAQA